MLKDVSGCGCGQVVRRSALADIGAGFLVEDLALAGRSHEREEQITSKDLADLLMKFHERVVANGL
jgi:hypothetical protein